MQPIDVKDAEDSKKIEVYLSQPGSNATAILHTVCAAGNWNAYQVVKAAKANLHAVDSWGNTALHYAISNPAIVQDLLAAGLSPNTKNKSGFTPTYIAGTSFSKAGAESLDMLLKKNGDPNIDCGGMTLGEYHYRLKAGRAGLNHGSSFRREIDNERIFASTIADILAKSGKDAYKSSDVSSKDTGKAR